MLKNKEFVFFLFVVMLINVGCSSFSGDKKPDVKSQSNRLPQQRQLNVEAALKAHLTAGIQYLGSGDMSRAHRHLKRALELDDLSVKVHNALAVFYQAEGDVTREEFHFNKALELEPEDSSVRHNYGSSLCRRGLYENARPYLSKAADDYRYAGRAESYQNLGHCEMLSGDKQAALTAFENAYRLNKNLPKSVLGLSRLRLERGDNETSYNLYKHFLQIARQTAESLWLGIRLERIFGDKDALASYELALRKRFPGSEQFRLYQESLAVTKAKP